MQFLLGGWWSVLESDTDNSCTTLNAVHAINLYSLKGGFYSIYIIYWRRKWQPTPVFLPGESRGQRSLVGCCPWGRTESDTTKATLHACIGEENSNPLQCSCLGNPRDGGAWWAAVYGVAQNWIWLKRLSSSSTLYNNKVVTFLKNEIDPGVYKWIIWCVQ